MAGGSVPGEDPGALVEEDREDNPLQPPQVDVPREDDPAAKDIGQPT